MLSTGIFLEKELQMERRKNTNRIQTKSTLPVRVLSRPLAVKSSLVSHGSCFTCYNHCHCSSFHNLSFCPPFSSHRSRRGKDLWLCGVRCVLQSEGLRIRSQAPPWASFCKSSCLMWRWWVCVYIWECYTWMQRIYTARPQHLLIIKINWLIYCFSYLVISLHMDR